MSVEYEIYRKEIVDFLQTVSIKFDLFALNMKNRLEIEKGIVITSDEENPYYQNLCGEYSILDSPIHVTSADTGEEILFDKSIHTLHPKTASLYRIPSIEYDILCQKYPNQVGLIKSILYPANDLQSVIKAENFSLIAYDETLLHPNERESLITALRRTLLYIYNRWYIADYYYEDMYPIAFMGIVWAVLPQALLAQRADNLRTSQVHPMHIWEYLTSRGLKDYRDILNDNQALFLYRNMEYLLQNKGKKSNLEILAENLLKDLQVSLVGKTIFQQTIAEVQDCVHVPEFLSEDVVRFGSDEQYEESVTESMSQILHRIKDEGYYPNLSAEIVEQVEDRFGETEVNILPTRLLELKKAILNTPYERLLVRFLFDTFILKLSRGKLQYRVSFLDPNLNLTVDLSLEDAILLFQYAHYKESQSTLDILPISHVTMTPYVLTKPSKIDLPQLVRIEDDVFPMETIVDVDRILREIPFNDASCDDQEEFLQIVSSQFDVYVSHLEHLRRSGHLTYHKAMGELYPHLQIKDQITLALTSYQTYAEWIASSELLTSIVNGYDGMAESPSMYRALCDLIISNLLPTDNDYFSKYTAYNKDYTKIYNGLKKLFIQLCSYRLTFLETDRSRVTFIISPHKVVSTYDGSDDLNVLIPHTSVDIISAQTDRPVTDLTEFDDVDILETDEHISGLAVYSCGIGLESAQLDSGIIYTDNQLKFTLCDDQMTEVVTPLAAGSQIFTMVEPI